MQCFANKFKFMRIYQLPFIDVSATRYQFYLNLANFCISYLQMCQFTTTYSVIYHLISDLLLISVSTTCPYNLKKQSPEGVLQIRCSQTSVPNTCSRVSYLIKLQAWPATLLKKRLWNKCFSVNFAIILRIPFFVGRHWWLLFYFVMGVCTIVPKENCPPGTVRIRLGGLGLALGVISLGRICPRTLVM